MKTRKIYKNNKYIFKKRKTNASDPLALSNSEKR